MQSERQDERKASDFKPGDAVTYIGCDPTQYEHGIVSSVNHLYVFVRYGRGQQSQATHPADLILTKK